MLIVVILSVALRNEPEDSDLDDLRRFNDFHFLFFELQNILLKLFSDEIFALA